MKDPLNRRDFFRLTGTLVAGTALLPGSLPGAARGVLDTRRATAKVNDTPSPNGDLPPRTVGLRTLGGDFRFDPIGLRIEPGSRVVWLNMGDFHTASAFHPDNAQLLSGDVPLRIPEGAKSWHSGMLGLTAGTEFDHDFEVEGVYDYFCQPHYSFGMVGRIVVGGPRGGPAVTRPLSELNEASRAVMPSIDAIMAPRGRTYEWAARINGILLLRSHGDPLEAAVDAVRTGVESDSDLGGVLDAAKATAEFDDQLRRFLEGAVDGTDYERLVQRADAAKRVMREAHGAG